MEVFPFPKFQLHPVMLPEEIVELLVKLVTCPMQTVFELKIAAGVGLPGFIVTAAVPVHPLASVTVIL